MQIFSSSIEQHLDQIEIFCNIINAFAVTFDQFNLKLIPFCTMSLHPTELFLGLELKLDIVLFTRISEQSEQTFF